MRNCTVNGWMVVTYVENKIDLISNQDVVNDETEMKKLANENKFDNYFRTFAKWELELMSVWII